MVNGVLRKEYRRKIHRSSELLLSSVGRQGLKKRHEAEGAKENREAKVTAGLRESQGKQRGQVRC